MQPICLFRCSLLLLVLWPVPALASVHHWVSNQDDCLLLDSTIGSLFDPTQWSTYDPNDAPGFGRPEEDAEIIFNIANMNSGYAQTTIMLSPYEQQYVDCAPQHFGFFGPAEFQSVAVDGGDFTFVGLPTWVTVPDFRIGTAGVPASLSIQGVPGAGYISSQFHIGELGLLTLHEWTRFDLSSGGTMTVDGTLQGLVHGGVDATIVNVGPGGTLALGGLNVGNNLSVGTGGTIDLGTHGELRVGNSISIGAGASVSAGRFIESANLANLTIGAGATLTSPLTDVSFAPGATLAIDGTWNIGNIFGPASSVLLPSHIPSATIDGELNLIGPTLFRLRDVDQVSIGGRVHVSDGSHLRIDSVGLTVPTLIDLGPGAELTVDDGGQFRTEWPSQMRVAGTVSIDGPNAVGRLPSGYIDTWGVFHPGTIVEPGGLVQIGNGADVRIGYLRLDGGDLIATGGAELDIWIIDVAQGHLLADGGTNVVFEGLAARQGGITFSGLDTTGSGGEAQGVGVFSGGELVVQSGASVNLVVEHSAFEPGSSIRVSDGGMLRMDGVPLIESDLDVLDGGLFSMDSGSLARDTVVAGGDARIAVDTQLHLLDGSVVDLPGGGSVVVGSPQAPTPDRTLHVGSGGTLLGDGVVFGDLLIDDGGTFGPGSSPGAFGVVDDFTLGEGGVLEIEIGGTIPGVDFDRLNIGGDLLLDGLMRISFLDDFVPALNQQFTVLSYAGDVLSDSLEIEVVNPPGSMHFQYTLDNGQFILHAVPEPSTLLLLALGSVGLLAAARGRRR